MTGLDRAIQSWVVEHRWGPLDLLFEALSYIGSYGIVWLVIAFAISGFSWSRPWLWTRVGVAILISESVSGLLKDWIARDRPPLADPDPEPLVSLPATHSFPSGHATVSFACATALALAVPRLRVPLYALAALIAFSRVYVGVHYPLDVLAGAVLGVGIAWGLSGKWTRWMTPVRRPGSFFGQAPKALRMLGAALQRSAPPRRRG